MAYRIDYAPPQHWHRPRISWRMPLLTAAFFTLFLFGLKAAWPAGSEKLSQLLLPLSGSAESRAALQRFISDLRNGQPFYESLTAFCQRIIAYAELTPA